MNPNLFIVVLSDSNTQTNTYKMMTFMAYPCSEAAVSDAGCTFKQVSCTKCADPKYQLAELNPEIKAKTCQYLDGAKSCIKGWFEIDKMCYYDCNKQMDPPQYGDYINELCIEDTTICQKSLTYGLTLKPMATNSLFIHELPDTALTFKKVLFQVFCSLTELVGMDYLNGGSPITKTLQENLVPYGV